MSFAVYPQPDACRALMPTPEPAPPGPPSRPMACHMPKGHDGPHALVRRPGPIDRRWEGDARPPRPVTAAVPDPRFRDQLAEALIEPTHRWYSREARQAIADALIPIFAAELADLADNIPPSNSEHEAKAMLRDRAAALASPAPAPHAEEGQR